MHHTCKDEGLFSTRRHNPDLGHLAWDKELSLHFIPYTHLLGYEPLWRTERTPLFKQH